MNLKKIFAVSIAGLLTVSILFGCTALQQASDTTEDVTTSLHFVDYTRQGDGNGAGDGYYRLVPRADSSNNICFVDYKSRTQVYLCNRPECEHCDDTCTSWLPYGAGGGALFATEDHLYYLSFGNRNPDVVEAIGKDALPQLIQMARNGTEKEVIHTFGASDIIREGVVFDYNSIYFICDSFENFEQNGNLPERILYQYDITDRVLNKLEKLSPDDQIIGTSQREIFLSTTEGAADLSLDAENLQTKVWSYNVDTHEKYDLLTHSYLTVGRAYDGVYYLYDPSTTALSKTAMMQDGQTEVIREAVFETEFCTYPYEVKTVWGKHLFIMYEIPQNNERTEYKATLQSIDLVSGEVEPINLRTDVIFGTTTPKEVEIVDETSDQFLVIASVEYIDVTIPFTNAPITLSYPYFHYALIDKQDYLDSKPNYIPIEIG